MFPAIDQHHPLTHHSVCLQGEEAEGDTGDGAAARQEHEQPANVAVAHRGGAGQAGGLQCVPQRRDPEAAGGATGGLSV